MALLQAYIYSLPCAPSILLSLCQPPLPLVAAFFFSWWVSLYRADDVPRARAVSRRRDRTRTACCCLGGGLEVVCDRSGPFGIDHPLSRSGSYEDFFFFFIVLKEKRNDGYTAVASIFAVYFWIILVANPPFRLLASFVCPVPGNAGAGVVGERPPDALHGLFALQELPLRVRAGNAGVS